MRIRECTAVVLSVLIALAAYGDLCHGQSEVVVFGPRQYEKPKGGPVSYTETFPGIQGIDYTLSVQSGQDGLNEVKNVSVSINGTEVLDSSNLRKCNPASVIVKGQPENIIKVVLKGQGGNFVTLKIGAQPLNISITSPSSGESIAGPEIAVRGRLVHLLGNEAGVTVNGLGANVYGNEFFVNHVPLTAGANTLTARAADAAGNSAVAAITVNAADAAGGVRLRSNMESGMAPLAALFSVSASGVTPASYRLDFEGDGVIDYTGSDAENIVHTYPTAGIYYPKLEVVDNQGNSYSSAITLTVYSKEEITALLRRKWEGMRDALKNGDVEGAVAYFTERSKDRYRMVFEALRDQLPQIVDTFTEFNIRKLYENYAEYVVVANEGGKLYAYPGMLQKDGSGIWKFKDF